jgi:two-component system response regulator HydG
MLDTREKRERTTMFPSMVLLVSTDQTLISTVLEVIDSIDGLQLCVLTGADQVDPYLNCNEASLVLFHLTPARGAGQVCTLLQTIRATQRAIATVVVSDTDEATDALTVLRQGAADYLSRPILLNRLAYLVDVMTLRARHFPSPQPAPLPAVACLGDGHSYLYETAAAMGVVIDQVKRVAPQDTTLLLTGETGTGKTSLARVIHELSPRRLQPFLVVNCGSLSANLIESEMFGHARGAFTGADRDRTGKCAGVAGGTLLLDEIDALSPELQAKLLRVVEDRHFEPVGSNKSLRLEARVIAASNRNLEQEMAAGRFRSDLYYRLNVVAFYLPPLRERRQLIPALVAKYLKDLAKQNNRHVTSIVPAAMDLLREHHWPGNIRELRNVIERAVALCPGSEIQVSDLPNSLNSDTPQDSRDRPLPTVPLPLDRGSLASTKAVAEAQRIVLALEKHNNNRLRAAAELGISRMTLYKKLHRYGLMPTA